MERRALNRDLFQFRLLDSPQLRPDTPLAMGVPAVVANQVLALLRNMLRQFGQEVERGEDLEVAAWSATDHAAHGARRCWPERESAGSGPVPLDR